MMATSSSPGAVRTRYGRSIEFADLQGHFDKPLAESARYFNTCTTFFKKMCRQFGIKRWPFRKVQSLRRRLEAAKSAGEWEAVNQKIQDIYTTAYWAKGRGMSDDEDGDSTGGTTPNVSVSKTSGISFGTLANNTTIDQLSGSGSGPDQVDGGEIDEEGGMLDMDENEQSVCSVLSEMLMKQSRA